MAKIEGALLLEVAKAVKTVISLVCGLAVLVLVGCATVTVDSSRTEARARPARPADYPIELVNEPIPARPHKVIASVRARFKVSASYLGIAPPSEVIAALKREARALGGDALLPIKVTPTAGGGNYASPVGAVVVGPTEIWSALVIVWLGP